MAGKLDVRLELAIDRDMDAGITAVAAELSGVAPDVPEAAETARGFRSRAARKLMAEALVARGFPDLW